MNDASVPVLEREDSAQLRSHRALTRPAEGRALTPAQSEERSIIHRTDVARPEVDAFRELRTRLLAAAEGNFITLVAPVSRGSGGSFVARNLAAAFAFDEAKNALIVDCDLRHPSQHQTMRIDPPNGGLVDYLEDSDVDVDSVLCETGVPRLRLLAAGRARENGAEYFSSMRMRLLLDSLRTHSPDRYVFLDGPPVRGGPDARILSDLADMIVLVAGYGRDTPAAIAQAAGCFDSNKFAGVVFNQGA